MNTPARLGAYVLALAALFGATLAAGSAVGGPASGEHPSSGEPAPHAAPGEPAAGQQVPGGLQISQDGYTLNPLTTGLTPGKATGLRFTVTGPDGAPVTRYRVEHDKKLHLIVVARDLSGYQHLHPELSPGGVWEVRLTVPRAGAYRMFADFTPEGGAGVTLGADLHAAGDYAPQPPPAASRTATVDGYTVTLEGELLPGRSSGLTLKVTRGGRPVTDLQPYLGAYGHLVVLRAGDLAYLHVHPEGEPGDGTTASGPEITFQAEVPAPGDHRLFLDFQHDGVVRTAEFTATAGAAAGPRPSPVATGAPGGHGH
ncbi:hypothetical protein [Sphaerisporangium sp. TRM90804]|uniref:hypothetical protein n=1 Tax=Sphaerisporangium sp. TRM90804 TaxID=3031113 RepID=UPI00244C92CA|nr:hypothetical protein [Sphaerisporangium sp. TRM90804]MDH2430539.1 hypothetical protein [Sphaerisporangium sp. TRM90804]